MKDGNISFDWGTDFAGNGVPRYLQIVALIEQAVSDGRLQSGDRLPPQRLLAKRLKADLTTITRAYTEARNRHLVEAKGASGTFVAAPKFDLSHIVDLSMNIPPAPAGVNLAEFLKQGLSQVLMRSDVALLMTYHLGGGGGAARTAGAMWLAPMFDAVDAEQIIVCPGAQSVLAALILTLTRPGDVILTEPLVYPGLLSVASQLGRTVIAVKVDEDGLLPDALEELIKQYHARLVYLNPTQQNPTTRTMSESRRKEIVAVAIKHQIKIIEDDPYWLLTEQAPRPLAYFAPEHVFYVATLSKCLMPGLRTAYMLTPKGMEHEEFLATLRSFVLMSTPLTTALATQWIHDGSALTLLNGIRNEASARKELAEKILGFIPGISGSAIHRWQPLPAHWTSQSFARHARSEGLNVISSDAFCQGEVPPNYIRISLGQAKDRIELINALRKLDRLLHLPAVIPRNVIV